MVTVSQYDPTRETVGAIYRDAQINNRVEKVEVGELRHELMKSLEQDINEGIDDGLKEFEGREFYLTIHEKKDLQMPSCILRRVIKTLYRPWPEDDTLVFYVHPPSGDVRFCWCLPHQSEMANILNNANLYDNDYVTLINAWYKYDLYHFGFVKIDNDNWIPALNWKDKSMGKIAPYKTKVSADESTKAVLSSLHSNSVGSNTSETNV